jgi:hypothetical protein
MTTPNQSSMTSTREERPRRPPLAPALAFVVFFLLLGVLFTATGLNRPSIAKLRTVDLVHLLGAGANLGAGLTLLVLHFVLRRQG